VPAQQPVAWTLTETLLKGETTTHAYLWFTDPQNSAWAPLYGAPQDGAAPTAIPSALGNLDDEEIAQLQEVVQRTRAWLGANCQGQVPRTAIACIATLAHEALKGAQDGAAPQAAELTERDHFDLARWHHRLGELADAYYEAGRTAPARQRARAELMLHALDCATGWRARSALAARAVPAAPTKDTLGHSVTADSTPAAARPQGTVAGDQQ
jgi:hypothetical protein